MLRSLSPFFFIRERVCRKVFFKAGAAPSKVSHVNCVLLASKLIRGSVSGVFTTNCLENVHLVTRILNQTEHFIRAGQTFNCGMVLVTLLRV